MTGIQKNPLDSAEKNPTFYENQPVSDFKGHKVIRTPLNQSSCDIIGRKILYALAMIFSLGFARHTLKIQKLKQEIKEENKITFIPKDKVSDHLEVKKVDDLGKNLFKEEAKKALPPQNLKKPQTNAPQKKEDNLFPPVTKKSVEPLEDNPPRPKPLDATPPVAPKKNPNPDEKLEAPKSPQPLVLPEEPKIHESDMISTTKIQLKDFERVLEKFKEVHSDKAHQIDLSAVIKNPKQQMTRAAFMNGATEGKFPIQPVVIGKSDFVPDAMTEHLMRSKQDSKLGRKWEDGDAITNMEGALHTFMTPITPITMTGDYAFKGGHGISHLNGQGRNVILSAAIHPDFELGGNNEVVMKIVALEPTSIEGKAVSAHFKPLTKQVNGNPQEFNAQLAKYEKSLQQHMVYHLTADHRFPALNEIAPESIKNPAEVGQFLEALIKSGQKIDQNTFKNQFVKIDNKVISLEALFNLYAQQIRNEFTVLEALLPQGYVYTINPPSIFARQFGLQNVNILNRLQLLALKMQHERDSLENLKMIGFGDFADKGIVDLYRTAFPDKKACSKDSLFQDGPENFYSIQEDYALVIHNNSDAFGQNIESEGMSSLDGVIGSCSSAAANLKRDLPELVSHVVIAKSATKALIDS